jgi:hypothetical protein
MRPFRFLLVALLVAASPLSAAAGTWTVGPNFGLSVNTSQNSSATVLSWPADVFAFQPGLRIGYLQRGAPMELYMDTGFLLESSSGSSFRVLMMSGNFQHGLSGRSLSGPYLTAGMGFWMANDGGSSSTVPSLGMGLGARGILRHGHGSFRAEFRLDHYFEDQEAGMMPSRPSGSSSASISG